MLQKDINPLMVTRKNYNEVKKWFLSQGQNLSKVMETNKNKLPFAIMIKDGHILLITSKEALKKIQNPITLDKTSFTKSETELYDFLSLPQSEMLKVFCATRKDRFRVAFLDFYPKRKHLISILESGDTFGKEDVIITQLITKKLSQKQLNRLNKTSISLKSQKILAHAGSSFSKFL